MERREELWLDEAVRELTHAPPCLIMPTTINGKSIGLFYADRGDLGTLDQKAYQLFWQFCQQVNLGINILSLKK